MTGPSPLWQVHIGDLRMGEANGRQSRDRLAAIVAEINGPIAPGRDIHAIGAWPERGIPGTQPGPDTNGRHW